MTLEITANGAIKFSRENISYLDYREIIKNLDPIFIFKILLENKQISNKQYKLFNGVLVK